MLMGLNTLTLRVKFRSRKRKKGASHEWMPESTYIRHDEFWDEPNHTWNFDPITSSDNFNKDPSASVFSSRDCVFNEDRGCSVHQGAPTRWPVGDRLSA